VKKLRTILCTLTVLMCADFADASDEVVGEWNGIITTESLPQPVSISVKSLTVSETVLTLRYSLPRNCSMTAEYGGPSQAGEIFYFPAASNRYDWCATTLGRAQSHIKLTPTEANDLRYDIVSGKSSVESGILTRK